MILTPFYAQPSITWSKIYSPSESADDAFCICNSGSGFYYVGGHAHDSAFSNKGYLLKLNEYGDTLWGRYIHEIYDIWAIIATPDKGCILTGDSDSLRVIRLDSNGNIIWSKNFIEDFDLNRIRDIKKTLDGNYIACGYRDYQQDGIILKFDGNGELCWLKIYPATYFKIFLSIDVIPDGGYALTGNVKDADTAKTLLLKLNDSGNAVWEKQFKVSNQAANGGFIKKINTGYLIAGRTTDTLVASYYDWVYFMRTDENGNLTFVKLFGFYKYDYFTAAQYINDNMYIFSSFCWNDFISDTSFGKVRLTDSSGNIIISRNFYSNTSIIFRSIIKTNNNDIILAGSTKTVRNDDFLICRIDSLLQGGTIGVKTICDEIPQHFVLYQNYPNPFNPITKIKFSIPTPLSPPFAKGGRTQSGGFVTLKIYDILGREIVVLVNEKKQAGTYEVEWDASNYPSGIYFYRLTAGEYTECKKMVLIK